MSKYQDRTGWLTLAFAAASLWLVGCDSGKSSNGTNGGQSNNGTCDQGATRECVGPAACKGAQLCQADLTWSTCDCGTSGTGGAGGGSSTVSAGGSSTADAGGSTGAVAGGNGSVGGASAVGGAGGTTSANSDAGGAVGTGGVSGTNVSTSGGTTSATTIDTSSSTGGATSVAATGGATSVVATGGATSVVATGGATSVVATGGAANVGGASTAGGSTSSPYLMATDGWVVDAAHALQGPLYTYTDEGGSNIYPDCSSTGDCFADTGVTTQFCATGKVAKALDEYGDDCHLDSDYCLWDVYWGTALAINPNQQASATDPAAWDASKYTGITFTSTITTAPPNLRIYLNLVDGTQFCYDITASKTYSLKWSQFRTDCYTTGGATPTSADLAQVGTIAWQAGSNASAAASYDFCISDVKITP